MTERDYGTEAAMREQLREANARIMQLEAELAGIGIANAISVELVMRLNLAMHSRKELAERCDDLRKYIIMRKVTPECWEALEDD